MAVDHILEHLKEMIRQTIEKRGPLALDQYLYTAIKRDFAITQCRVDRAINEMVDAGEIVLERGGERGFPLVAKRVVE